jgi:hypothetical protein
LKTGAALTAKEKVIHEDGLVAVLKSLHDQLDREVLSTYGWADLLPLLDVANGFGAGLAASKTKQGTAPNPSTGAVFAGNAVKMPVDIGVPSIALTQATAKQQLTATLLERLVVLNATRVAEEKTGTVRWLRPEYQAPQALSSQQTPVVMQGTLDVDVYIAAAEQDGKTPWPDSLAAQIRAMANVLAAAASPITIDEIARTFGKRSTWQKSLMPLLESLEAMGRARRTDDDKWMSI